MTAPAPQLDLQMTVADLLTRWPQVIPVFLRYQMICIGCSMSPFDTLADAVRNYALPADEFFAEIQASITAASETTPTQQTCPPSASFSNNSPLPT